ncbi:hypothetical protein SCP_1602250 [Sparassis crispa]|uniref:Uncharacterized protein n=1 Tax=Sparassis crispa TaxID=139825 RepID=A0A401H586_9APHY|nr:hypothetical protein SCP_1602250 [Sparassis crispa]GBE89563.1 hypothetical protein SCP_1602250 [Sparassis crispa]
MQTLEMWDVQRGPWQILFHHSGDPVPVSIGRVTVHEVKPFRSDVADVHIPSSMDLCNTAETSQLDWAEKMSALFEWVGMACLGAQRLKANDRVDPYVAVYTPPTPSRVGDITYMRWTGLLTPEFVQSVIDTSIVKLSASSSLISLTMHGVPSSPVAYLRPAPSLTAPLRAPRPESEDTLCLILSSEKEGPRGEKLTWALAKSIGQWDMQWG